jgi:hypothetical protein
MKATDGQRKSRQKRQIDLVERITKITTRLVPEDEGVDLFYINNQGTRNARASQIKSHMEATGLSSGTPIGTQLRKKILNDQVYSVLQSGQDFERPLLLSIMTDGEPTSEADEYFGSGQKVFENVVLQCVDALEDKRYPDYGEH